MPGRYATKPGDVIKSYSGKLVEITDTDAEGRLVMADGISYVHIKSKNDNRCCYFNRTTRKF